jgi:hypothetical protein
VQKIERLRRVLRTNGLSLKGRRHGTQQYLESPQGRQPLIGNRQGRIRIRHKSWGHIILL